MSDTDGGGYPDDDYADHARHCPRCGVDVNPVAVPLGIDDPSSEPGWLLRCPNCPTDDAHVFERVTEDDFPDDGAPES